MKPGIISEKIDKNWFSDFKTSLRMREKKWIWPCGIFSKLELEKFSILFNSVQRRTDKNKTFSSTVIVHIFVKLIFLTKNRRNFAKNVNFRQKQGFPSDKNVSKSDIFSTWKHLWLFRSWKQKTNPNFR